MSEWDEVRVRAVTKSRSALEAVACSSQKSFFNSSFKLRESPQKRESYFNTYFFQDRYLVFQTGHLPHFWGVGVCLSV